MSCSTEVLGLAARMEAVSAKPESSRCGPLGVKRVICVSWIVRDPPENAGCNALVDRQGMQEYSRGNTSALTLLMVL